MTNQEKTTPTYQNQPLPWAIVDTRQHIIYARFHSQAFAQVSLNACSAKLSAYRDLLQIKELPED